jgi:hypothetical protein
MLEFAFGTVFGVFITAVIPAVYKWAVAKVSSLETEIKTLVVDVAKKL